jgi:hypothetical protein
MTEAESGEPVVEIRPIQHAGPRNAATDRALRSWLLRADPAAGTLTWTEEQPVWRSARPPHVLALPATGRPDAVSKLCLISYRWRTSSTFRVVWRPVLLDREGRTLATGRSRTPGEAEQGWPSEVFAPLRQLGITIVEEEFRSTAEANDAHPGAVPHAWLGTRWGEPVLGCGLAIVIVLIVFVAVFLTTH